MAQQEIVDVIITFLVLIGIFLLAYSAIRHQGILDTINEIKEIFKGKAEEVIEVKYA